MHKKIVILVGILSLLASLECSAMISALPLKAERGKTPVPKPITLHNTTNKTVYATVAFEHRALCFFSSLFEIQLNLAPGKITSQEQYQIDPFFSLTITPETSTRKAYGCDWGPETVVGIASVQVKPIEQGYLATCMALFGFEKNKATLQKTELGQAHHFAISAKADGQLVITKKTE